MKINELEFF